MGPTARQLRRGAALTISYSLGFWTAVALQFAYDHAMNAPVTIRRLHP